MIFFSPPGDDQGVTEMWNSADKVPAAAAHHARCAGGGGGGRGASAAPLPLHAPEVVAYTPPHERGARASSIRCTFKRRTVIAHNMQGDARTLQTAILRTIAAL